MRTTKERRKIFKFEASNEKQTLLLLLLLMMMMMMTMMAMIGV